MSINIMCKDEIILRCRNSLFGVLHEEIESIIERDNLELPLNILRMLEKMDQNIYGEGPIWVDIADYLKTQRDVGLFVSLVSDAIKKYKEDYPTVPQDYRDVLWGFHDELAQYGKSLEK